MGCLDPEVLNVAAEFRPANGEAEGGSVQVTPAEEAHLLQLKMFQTSSMKFSPLETIQMLLFRPSVFAEGLNIV